jgi:sirohydrochlorin cobaltochelatase
MMTAHVLIAHGSPDPDWAMPLQRVVARIRELEPEAAVALALLTEEDSLDEALARLQAAGHVRVQIHAALLSAGGRHLKRDIPAWIEAARKRFPALELVVRPGALGEAEQVIDALARAALDSLES